jgi:hypothetical protein
MIRQSNSVMLRRITVGRKPRKRARHNKQHSRMNLSPLLGEVTVSAGTRWLNFICRAFLTVLPTPQASDSAYVQSPVHPGSPYRVGDPRTRPRAWFPFGSRDTQYHPVISGFSGVKVSFKAGSSSACPHTRQTLMARPAGFLATCH